jgi:hypothetical protein
MRRVSRALLSGGLGFAVSLIAGCGGGAGLLSGDQANNLSSQLDQVSSAVSAGHCVAAQNAASSFGQAVLGLPSTVSVNLRRDLAAAANTINQSVPQQCHATTPKTTQTTTSTPTATTQTSTTTSTPTTSSTATQTPSTPTTTPSTPTTTSPGSSGGGGLSGGSDGGGGGGLSVGGSGGGSGNGNG